MFGHKHLGLVAILMPLLAHATATPGIFELDLLFPRNDTYFPVPVMPVVFAVQNPALADPLDAIISWSMSEVGNFNYVSPHFAEQTIHLPWLGPSNLSSPYLATDLITTLSGVEQTWIFTWSLSTTNCSKASPPKLYFGQQSQMVIFKTNNTAQAPNLEAATSANTCNVTQGFAFDVAAIEPVYSPDNNGEPSCPVLGPSTPTRNPCAVTINNAAASSISSALSYSACTPTSFSCTATPTSKSQSGHLAKPSAIWVLMTLGFMLFLES